MKNKFYQKCAFWLYIFVPIVQGLLAQNSNSQWSKGHIQKWYKEQGWLIGCNFIPSNAVNQLEMWQNETFDTTTINRELGWAASIGFNVVRVFLHHEVWSRDSSRLLKNMNTFLSIAHSNKAKVIFVFFDDCWRDTYESGKQPDPIPGVHNSGWIQDPGSQLERNPTLIDTLKGYVESVLQRFRYDTRIVGWDLYNEPGQFGHFNRSYLLLTSAFLWARSVNPTQPLTVGYYDSDKRLDSINDFIFNNSDFMSYHCYDDSIKHRDLILMLSNIGRPMVCTEYMARKRGSTFQSILPILKKNNIGAINWGLVSGKTNTIFPWDEKIGVGREPLIWFHDIFRGDGSPYSVQEIEVIKKITLR